MVSVLFSLTLGWSTWLVCAGFKVGQKFPHLLLAWNYDMIMPAWAVFFLSENPSQPFLLFAVCLSKVTYKNLHLFHLAQLKPMACFQVLALLSPTEYVCVCDLYQLLWEANMFVLGGGNLQLTGLCFVSCLEQGYSCSGTYKKNNLMLCWRGSAVWYDHLSPESGACIPPGCNVSICAGISLL